MAFDNTSWADYTTTTAAATSKTATTTKLGCERLRLDHTLMEVLGSYQEHLFVHHLSPSSYLKLFHSHTFPQLDDFPLFFGHDCCQ